MLPLKFASQRSAGLRPVSKKKEKKQSILEFTLLSLYIRCMETQVQVIDTQVKTVIPIDKLNKLRSLKLTKKKQAIFLEEYAGTFNISKAAYKAGISRQTVYQTMKTDPTFKENVQTIKDAYLDTIEESSIVVALQADARGFNDRKLNLQAHRPEVYQKQPDIQINQQINVGSQDEISSIIDRISPKSK